MAQVGPYALVRELARGAMGVVYEAQAPDGARVALKVLASTTTADALARFDRERRLLLELSGAHGFVPLLDAGEQLGRPWFVMPLLLGGNLRDRLRRGPLGVTAAVELGHQLGVTIGRAHARGIVHRDLKPENILFEREGDTAAPRIADLGVARHFREGQDGARSANLSRTGAMVGTACYMAPEQINDARSVGPPADVFALAQLLYECLTGVTPFARDSLHESLVALVEGRFAPARERAPGAPAWLEAALARALSVDPAQRPADGQAFARALAEGPHAKPRPGRALAGAAVGAAALAVAGATWVVVSRPGRPQVLPTVTEPPAQPAPLPAPVTETPAAEPATETPATEAPALEPEPQGANGWIRRAVALIRASQHADAVEAYRRAIALDPQRSTRILLGFALISAGRLDEAVAEGDRLLAESVDPAGLNLRGTALIDLRRLRGNLDLERSLKQIPSQGNTWATLSVGRVRARLWSDALTAAERALEKDPRPGVALRSRGLARVAQGDLPAGRADLEAFRTSLGPAAAAADAELQGGLARVGAPTDPAPAPQAQADRLVEEAWLAQAQRAFSLSRRLVEQALALVPDHVVALAMSGAALPGVEGLALLDRAIARGPAEGWVHVERGNRRLAKKDHLAAADDYERALALDGPAADVMQARARALHLARDPRAVDAALEVTRVFPKQPAGWVVLSQAHRGRGDAASAVAAATRATELAPAALEGWRELGQAQLQRSRWPDALAAFDRLLALAPDDPGGLAGRGVALLSLGRAAEGLPDLERAAKERPDSGQLWIALASARASTGDARGAVAAASRVLELQPGDAEALSVRALAFSDLGQLDQARADLAELRRLAPTVIERDANLLELERRVRR